MGAVIGSILDKLKERFGDARCELNYNSVFELLVAVILSAQCTDKRVNIITDKLFGVYNTPEQFASLKVSELIPYIHAAGFYNNKAQSIIEASGDIVARYGGQVPSDIESLMSLRGVGRKTANVVYAVGFGGQAIAVDTHVYRVSHRLGLACGNTPDAVERELCAIVAPNRQSEGHHLLLFLGRYICKARKPDCAVCPVTGHCKYFAQSPQLIKAKPTNNQSPGHS